MTELRNKLQDTLGSAYTIERELGGGGMSRVFLAEETAFGRRVVVKLLSPELVAGVNVDRFKREIQLAAKLQHPHIVPVITAGESGDLPYYTMPFVEGESLRVRLEREGRLPISDCIAILRDVAKALAYAHERGVVHRDIKPDNVLLFAGSATVADFGIAKAIAAAKTQERGATLTQIGTSIGTPAYMAPEQAAGDPDVDHRADIYAFGCMAYEMLAGRTPFSALSPQRLLAAHMAEAPQDIAALRPEVSPALAMLVMRCLEKDPGARPQSVAAMLPALESDTSSSDRAAAPALLLKGRHMLVKALAWYAVAFASVAILARAAIVGIGLPDWVFPGSLLVMVLVLPVILFTAYAQRAARRAFTATPTYTPGGTPSMHHGTMATLALRASPHLSWRRTTRWGAYALAGFVVLVATAMTMRAAGVGPFATIFSTGRLKSGDAVIVADFAISNSPDTSLGHVIAEAVKADLGQSSSAVSVTSEAQVSETLDQMKQPNARLLLPVAREVAQRRGVKAIVDGSLNPLGNGFVVKLRLVTSDSSRELASFTDAADAPSQLIAVVGGLTRKLRAKMGESLKSVQSGSQLAGVTTTSLEALRKYTVARDALNRSDRTTFVRLLREAIALDSNFVAAYGILAAELANRGGRNAEVARLATRAYQLRDRVGLRERHLSEWLYFRMGPPAVRDVARANAALDTIALNPRGNSVLQTMGLTARDSGDLSRADSLLRLAVAADTTSTYALGNLLTTQYMASRRAAAESTARLFIRRFPENQRTRSLPFMLDSGNVTGAIGELTRQFASTAHDPFGRSFAAVQLARVAALRGSLREETRWDSLRTVSLLEREVKGAPLLQAATEARLRIVTLGDTAGATRLLDAAIAHTPLESMDVLDRPYTELASAYAAAGRPDRARLMVAGVQQQQLENDPRFGYEISIPRAEIAMAERHWDEAIRILRGTKPGGCFDCLYAARAYAFDGSGQRDSAIVAYERYLGILTSYGAVATVMHRRVGELYEASGDLAKAVAHYQKFVELWKGADPELQPQVADVRQRIARLQRQLGRAR